MNNNQDLMMPKEVALLLGISINTLYTWKCTGRYNLSVVKVGRLNRYIRQDVHDFIDNNREFFLHSRNG